MRKGPAQQSRIKLLIGSLTLWRRDDMVEELTVVVSFSLKAEKLRCGAAATKQKPIWSVDPQLVGNLV